MSIGIGQSFSEARRESEKREKLLWYEDMTEELYEIGHKFGRQVISEYRSGENPDVKRIDKDYICKHFGVDPNGHLGRCLMNGYIGGMHSSDAEQWKKDFQEHVAIYREAK